MTQQRTIEAGEIQALFDLAVKAFKIDCEEKGFRYIQPHSAFSIVTKSEIVLMYEGGYLASFDIASGKIKE